MTVRRTFPLAALTNPRRANPLILAAALFALGLVVGAAVRPSFLLRRRDAGCVGIRSRKFRANPPPTIPLAHRLDPSIVYPAEVIRIIDGDTFEARVRVWPGLDVDTKVRLRGVDAAELHARCASELDAGAGRACGAGKILSEGGVTISRVGVDKYGGRVDATIATRGTADVSAALLNGGFARAYDGGKRGSWCG